LQFLDHPRQKWRKNICQKALCKSTQNILLKEINFAQKRPDGQVLPKKKNFDKIFITTFFDKLVKIDVRSKKNVEIHVLFFHELSWKFILFFFDIDKIGG